MLVIATQDRDHVGHAIKALELGYDILLEKPISPIKDELYRLLKIQGTIPFFVPNLSQIEDLIEDGYLFNNSLKRLKEILKKEYKDDISYIFKKICYGIDIKDLVNEVLPMINIKDDNDINEVNSYVSIIDDVCINNNQRRYRGYSYKEFKSLNQKVIIPAMTESDYLC